MTRCRLDVDPEGWTVRPRTRQTRKEPTMPSQPDDAVWLIADPTEGQPGGRIIVNLVDASAALEFARGDSTCHCAGCHRSFAGLAARKVARHE